ncbi:MAG TPA: tetratricopeptide repeat protein [Burkholderiales bacterium]|nr:tetratricopeptide repeat protein [Burkholderiales bacterium]
MNLSFLRPTLCAWAALLLAGCAHQPPAEQAASAPVIEPQVATVTPAEALKVAPEPDLPKQRLSNDILYGYLLGEFAAQRGNMQVSAQAYVELARRTRDPRIARRALEIAYVARQPELASEAARIWYETEPDSAEALRRLAGLLISTNRVDEARPYLKRILETEGVNQSEGFLQLHRLLAGNPDREENLRVVQELAKDHQAMPEARFAIAHAAFQANKDELALAEIRAASKLKPDWDVATLLEAQILQRAEGDEAAAAVLSAYLAKHPQSRDVRLNYARALIGQKKYSEARLEFERLLQDNPANAEVIFAVAVLSAQLKDYETAERHFKRLLEMEYRDPDAVRLYLGQIAEDRKDYPEALKWYRSIDSGDNHLTAQFREAQVRVKQGDLAGARKFLQQINPQTNQQRVQIILAEASLLNEAGRKKEAFAVISDGLEKLPNDPDLLYQQSMLAEKIGRIDVMESSLRKLIRLKPDHAHAYNALGYSYADRNEKLKEAHELIQKANALAPEDYFIMDSMGWVLYRQGKYDEAIKWLRRAYSGRNDAEIAAHLGEVLWKKGEQTEAQKIWDEASQRSPDNAELLETVKRLKK